ncbi:MULTISPECIES: sulfate/molybdate ABC transporter ATP-binding protein [unclassified Leifsonia]|uniref:sulfate/molybdate ABC transporter ATP-binding protein n=1 Tax=unclassified Leifsonia TaxID=2663824 RepID=UPI0006F6F5FC|nr:MULTISPECIES: ABC transporter ATP-binding protein [unclassified Leifsonia]KQX07992.1 molybdenum ABC transporter ATP-binding protein [Leifsonia sp. Root1293]KRA12274.1 molybdenum ABC transporter ATP-binding protein [Leifsonia sp. Root60]
MTFSLSASVADRGFDMEFSIADGETVAVLGPNGAGKSTLLSLIAGLLKPDSGRAVLADTVLFDLSPQAGGRRAGARTGTRNRWLPPHARGVSLLAQDALLFPHLTVLDNVAFGPRSAGVHRAEADSRARDWLRRVDAAELSERRPGQLSGGQAQRIAVARALASDPRLLLLDEPLAALDVSVAPAIRRMLRDVLADRTAVIVTHDVLDAYTLADRVVVVEAGRIVDIGPTRQVLDRPSTQFAAGLAAVNLLTGTASADGVDTDAGGHVSSPAGDPLPEGARVGVAIRPGLVAVSVTEPTDPALTVVAGVILDLETRGDLIRVRTEHLAADVTPRVVADLDLSSGAWVWLAFHPADAVAYPL